MVKDLPEKDLSELAKRERAEYARKWRAANKEKARQHNVDYWKRRVLKRLEAEH